MGSIGFVCKGCEAAAPGHQTGRDPYGVCRAMAYLGVYAYLGYKGIFGLCRIIRSGIWGLGVPEII